MHKFMHNKLSLYIYRLFCQNLKYFKCNGGGVENDITFDHTLYTGTDPESFGGVDVILNVH